MGSAHTTPPSAHLSALLWSVVNAILPTPRLRPRAAPDPAAIVSTQPVSGRSPRAGPTERLEAGSRLAPPALPCLLPSVHTWWAGQGGGPHLPPGPPTNSSPSRDEEAATAWMTSCRQPLQARPRPDPAPGTAARNLWVLQSPSVLSSAHSDPSLGLGQSCQAGGWGKPCHQHLRRWSSLQAGIYRGNPVTLGSLGGWGEPDRTAGVFS